MKKKTISNQIARVLITGLMLLFIFSLVKAQPRIATPDGFAGHAGTTGGGNASPITVSSASAFKSAVSGNSAKVIYVNGFLNVGNVSIGSNKTIVGMSESSGIGGGKISVNGSNYIFQNLIIGPGGSDVMEVSGGKKVFITKCSFHDCGDELLSIVRGADFVTISWCKFYFERTHDHALAHLIGNSDGATGDRGKLNTTMHHNWYANGVRSRMPRVRYGKVHIYNNYYNSVGNSYCIGVGVYCNIRLENSHFDNVSNTWNNMGGASNGKMGWKNLKFEGCSQPSFISNSYPVFNPPYSFSLDPVGNVESIVRNGAGNVMGSVVQVRVTGVTVSPTSASVGVGKTTQLTATVSPSNATNKSVSWSSNNTSVAKVSSSGVVTGVSNGSATITVKTQDGGYTATSRITVSSTNFSVTGVSVSPTSASVGVGKTTQLTATVSPSNATNKSVSWSSNNTSVAKVSSSGVVTGVSKGSATITVKTQDGGFTASCKITVSDGGSSGCNNPTAISIPFAKDGEGEFCWSTTKEMGYVNSWNLEKLTINGTDFTNTWSDKLPSAQNGKWIIHYIGKYSWSHFEASAAKSAEPVVSGLEKDIRVYPNPFKDGLYIDLSRSPKVTRIEVINSLGQVVETLNEGQVQGSLINLKIETGPGPYLIQIYSGENMVSKTVVKE